MRILHLVGNNVWGGGERYVLDLCLGVKERGIEARTVCRPSRVVTEKFKKEGVPVTELKLGGVLDFVSPRKLAKILKEIKGETIIHVHNFKTAGIALKAKRISRREDVKVVCTRHLVRPAKNDLRHRRLYNSLDAIIFVSELARQRFLSSGFEPKNPEKLKVVHNAIRLDDTVKTEKSDVDVVKSERPIILFMGRLDPEKGVELLLDALSLLKDESWRAQIVGTGEEKYVETLKAKAEALGIAERIEWLGFQSEVVSFVRRADIGVMPSVAEDSFGLVLLEFMSQGVPVVSTSRGAQREIITSGQEGLLAETLDPSEFAIALKTLLDNPHQREEMGAAGLKTVSEKFSYDKFIDTVIKIYREV